MSDESLVRKFYSGQNFFITGGTGFVGISLIEKILRTIPDAGKIYLLMRPKKNKDVSTRLEEFPKHSVFEQLLKTESPDIFKKLVPVAGDVGAEDLGLSAQDRKTLIDNVHVVVHSAATLDFADSLRNTVQINLLGTRKVIELCKSIKNLKVLIHVSSCFVNSYLTEVKEKVYDAPEDTEKVISLVQTLSDQALADLEPKLFKDHPNAYTFTKHLAELEVKKYAETFPCTIVRPSMITGSWKEPEPGWTCAKTGPQGFFLGASKGVIRRLPLKPDIVTDYIPVDVVVNQLLVAGWDAGKAPSPSLTVYHCASSAYKPFRWASILEKTNDMMHTYPLKGAVWYPYLKAVPSLLHFRISSIFVHFFPGLLLDLLLRLTGGRPMLWRLHTNVWKSLNRLERFVFGEWKFYNENTVDLAQKLNQTDRQLFFIDIASINWENYFDKLILGIRKNLSKEPEKTLAAARNKQKILFILHQVWQVLILSLLWYLVASILGHTMMQAIWSVPVIYYIYCLL